MASVAKLLAQLKTNKATAGLDNISARMLCDCPTFTYLINMSLRTGTLPGTCKCAKLEALFEQVDRCDKENYRPTSVLFHSVKLIERFVHLRLYGHLLAQSNLLFDERFGFRQRRYTATAPCQFNDDLLNSIRDQDVFT